MGRRSWAVVAAVVALLVAGWWRSAAPMTEAGRAPAARTARWWPLRAAPAGPSCDEQLAGAQEELAAAKLAAEGAPRPFRPGDPGEAEARAELAAFVAAQPGPRPRG